MQAISEQNWDNYREFQKWQRDQQVLLSKDSNECRRWLESSSERLMLAAAPTMKKMIVSFAKKKWRLTTAIIGGRVVILTATFNATSRMKWNRGSYLAQLAQDTYYIGCSRHQQNQLLWLIHDYPYCLQDSAPKAVEEMQKVASVCADTDEFLQQLGLESQCCAVCGSYLTDEFSKQMGIGPVCARKIYGDAARAAVIVERVRARMGI